VGGEKRKSSHSVALLRVAVGHWSHRQANSVFKREHYSAVSRTVVSLKLNFITYIYVRVCVCRVFFVRRVVSFILNV
jgi:hypothetical protein